MKRGKHASLNLKQRFARVWPKSTRYLVWVIVVLLLFGVVAASYLTPTAPTATPLAPRAGATLSTATPAPTHTAAQGEPPTDTNGIIIGGVILVLIIIGGTLQVLRPRSNE